MNLLTAQPRPAPCETFRVITGIAELESLRPAWQDLLDAGGAAEPMRSPDWLLTWWQVYGRGRELRVGVFQDGERLIGLAPLCRRRYWYRPGIPFRRLEFLGSDVDEDDGVCSNHLNLICRAGAEEVVVRSFFERLSENAYGAWDECVLSALDQDNSLTQRLAAEAQTRRISFELKPTIAAPFTPLQSTWEEFHRALPKKNRHDINQALRNFEAWAGDGWLLELARTPEELRAALATLAELHCRRWQSEGHGGAFGSKRFRAFHERFAPLALERGQLVLSTLKVHGEAIAATYALAANGRMYLYQMGRELDVPPKVRLGIMLVVLGIQEAIRRGLGEYDFLAGQAQYKSIFAKSERTLCELRLVRRGLPEFVRRLARSTLQLARGIRAGAQGLMVTSGRLLRKTPETQPRESPM